MCKKVKILFIILACSIIVKGQQKFDKPVKWSYASKIINNKEAILFLKAELPPSWRIYSVNQKDGGPTKTSFQFLVSKDYFLLGKVIEPNPIKHFEKVFDMDVLYFKDTVVFSQKIKLISKSPFVVKGTVEFMACTDEKCLPAEEVVFSIPVK